MITLFSMVCFLKLPNQAISPTIFHKNRLVIFSTNKYLFNSNVISNILF